MSKKLPLIVDAHLDLSMNAMEWNRDLKLDVSTIRNLEKGMTDKPDRGNATVSFPALQKGNVFLVVATLIARYVEFDNPLPGWYSPEQAWAQTQGQLAWYFEMERTGHLKSIRSKEDLETHIQNWQTDDFGNQPLGYVLSLEGADSIVDLGYLEKSWENGLRALGPAHYGKGRYAYGTDSEGGLGAEGKALLKKMEELGIILDVTHLCDTSFWEAIDCFQGPLWASHSNCRALVNHNRQFDDEQIKVIIERGGVVGGALDAWMMISGWKRGKSTPKETGLSLEVLIDHLDHICQLAGNANHIGIGSDLDGAFGTEQCPVDLDTIADLQKIPALLKKRGFSDEDISKVLSGNWLRFLKNHLPHIGVS